MTGLKTNERPGSKAVLRHYRMSASKARVVLDLVRDKDVDTAREILANTSREAADVIGKVLASAVANATNNDGLQADELYVAAAYADEGPTLKRFTPRARGRAGKILKRSCHITVVVARLDDVRLEKLRAARSAAAVATRQRRVALSRRRADQTASVSRREARAIAEAEAEAQAAAAAELDDETTTEMTNDVDTTPEVTDEVTTDTEDVAAEAATEEAGE
jgi:large subunit ribosomal protein L22